jgi:hypothetical protein
VADVRRAVGVGNGGGDVEGLIHGAPSLEHFPPLENERRRGPQGNRVKELRDNGVKY